MFSPNLDRRQLARWTTLLLMLGILSALIFMGARTANAGVIIYVTANAGEGTSGDGICSLREAIDMARTSTLNPDCTIIYGTNFALGYNVVYVPAGTYSLNPANGPLILGRDIRVRGPQVNIPAGSIETFATRTLSPASEAIISYSGAVSNLPIIRLQGANIEVEGLAFTGDCTSQTNVFAINFQGLFSNVEISNNIFSNLTYGIAMRTAGGLPNDVVGNAFIDLNCPGTLTGVGINFPSINGQNIQIEGNVFINLPNYAIHFPTIGSLNLPANVTINGNGFNNVAAAVRLNRNTNVDITSNRIETVTGSSSVYPGAITINNATFVDINANSITSSTIPAIATTGSGINNNIFINGNRFYQTGLTTSNIAVALNAGTFAPSPTVDVSDNWWGDNSGYPLYPIVNGLSDPGSVAGTPTWTAYQIAAAPAPIGLPNPGNMQSELLVDFFRTNDGTTNLNDLDGFGVMRRNTPISVSLPLSPPPIGTLDTSVVRVFNDQTNRFRFTSDNINPGTQIIEAALDNEVVGFNLNVNTPNQVICDFSDGVFSDPGVHITEGATIGDRCILRLTSNPGAGNFVDVTINTSTPGIVGFYNGTPPPPLSGAPNTSFTVRFGAVSNPSLPTPVVAWNTGVAINFNAIANSSDPAGSEYYANLVTCTIAGVIGTPPYSAGACPSLPAIPVTIYDAGITFDIVNSDLDLGVDQTDVCTFPAFDRTYGVRLSGPPGLRAVVPTVSTETVTVNTVSGTPTIVTVSPASLSFTRANWNTAQNATLQRNNAFYTGPVNPNNPPSVAINHSTTSNITGGSTTSQYAAPGVSRVLTVIRPGCPLMDKEGANVDVGISQSVSAASVSVGEAVSFNISYWGDGLANADPSAAGLVININIPANVAFLGISEANSSYCAAPNEGQMGPVTVTCVFPAGVAVNGGTVSVMTVAAAPGTASVSADVSVFGANDINAANNTATAEALIN